MTDTQFKETIDFFSWVGKMELYFLKIGNIIVKYMFRYVGNLNVVFDAWNNIIEWNGDTALMDYRIPEGKYERCDFKMFLDYFPLLIQ